jgi:catechol 2,3-dioxygenase-like lactoylglutathione lyase family enzyme/ketosteroid isomerase-like protein
MIERLDHIVLTVRDVDLTCAFYTRTLGMEVVTFGAGRKALHFGAQKINVHEAGNAGATVVAARPTPGSGDFCLITDRPLPEWIERLRAAGVSLEAGPVTRTGALGPMESVYFRDPDLNLVEISRYEKQPAGVSAGERDTAGVSAPERGPSGAGPGPTESGDDIAPLREWLRGFAGRVRAVDYEGGKTYCAPDMIAFGTYAAMVQGLDAVVEAQWKKIWPTIREFSIRADKAQGGIAGDTAWVAAPWDSLGTRADGTTFERPGRLTIVFTRRDGRWLARHTHLSLVPEPRRVGGGETP